MATLAELQNKMKLAVEEFNKSGDMSQIQAVSAELNKAKAEIAKAQAEKVRVEAEALAGKREDLATRIHAANRMGQPFPNLDKELTAVKAWGFTYKVDKANPNEPDVTYKAVQLSVQTVKVKTGKGGGGNTGKSKDEYGKSLGEIFEEFATDKDRAKLAAATSNSAQWQAKVAVKKAAIASGALKPVK